MGGVPAQGMGTGMRWSLRPFPTQTVLGFYEKEAKVQRKDRGWMVKVRFLGPVVSPKLGSSLNWGIRDGKHKFVSVL